ncbi:DUF6498-containing protein [Aestuariimicrobium ganziense]|uniref:DUF6498-containing protein n=1 Tax=Aestuariimicrobium ganziense TaxID=2773677 RepID=UPI00194141D9|nr:DUF6498-containing protein [Aestuariimicrobium ganziense]
MPTRVADAATIAFVIFSNIAVAVPVLFWGAPAGNPLLLLLVDSVAAGVLTLVAVARAERRGQTGTLPTMGRLGPIR